MALDSIWVKNGHIQSLLLEIIDATKVCFSVIFSSLHHTQAQMHCGSWLLWPKLWLDTVAYVVKMFTSKVVKRSNELVLGTYPLLYPQDPSVPLTYKIWIYLDSLYILWHTVYVNLYRYLRLLQIWKVMHMFSSKFLL